MVIFISILIGGVFNALHSQLCCGAFAISVIKTKNALFLDNDTILATYIAMNSYSKEITVAQSMERRDGYFVLGMRPMSEFVVSIEINQRQMKLTVRNPPGYDSRSYAVANLQFSEGDFFVDEKQLDRWCNEHDKIEKEGIFKGFHLIPIEFVKPLQKGK